jgi:hypothetical protein
MSDLDTTGAGLGGTPEELVEDPCAADNGTEMFGLRVGGIFIILVSSSSPRTPAMGVKDDDNHR